MHGASGQLSFIIAAYHSNNGTEGTHKAHLAPYNAECCVLLTWPD